MKVLIKLFRYLEPLWLGRDHKISLRQLAAMFMIIDFISNLSHAIYRWDASKSMEGLSLALGIEAGLIVSLLGISAIQNFSSDKLESGVLHPNGTNVEIETKGSTKIKTELSA